MRCFFSDNIDVLVVHLVQDGLLIGLLALKGSLLAKDLPAVVDLFTMIVNRSVIQFSQSLDDVIG